MTKKLPREFLWQDYESMDEFLKEPINQELYKVYLTIKDAPFKITMPDVKVFNELYYQCVKFCYGDVSMDDITNSIEADLGFVYSKSLISSMMLAVIFTQKKRIDNYYEILLYLQDNRGWYFDTFTDFINQRQSIYETNLKPRPANVETAVIKVDSWFDVTSYYSQRVITKIVNLWESKEEQLFVLGDIEESFNNILDKKRLLPIQGAVNDNDTADETYFASFRKKIERSKIYPSNGKKYTKGNIRLKPQTPQIILPPTQVAPLKNTEDDDKRTSFWNAIRKQEKGDDIINFLHKRVDGKRKPLDIVMPFYAAIKAGAIRRPSWSEYISEFSDEFCKKSSFTRLTSDSNNPYEEYKEVVNELKKEFEAI